MHAMTRQMLRALSPAAALCGGAVLLGCGSGTKTVTVSSAPPETQTQPSTKATTPTTTAKSPATSQGTPTGTTRSAPAPAFAQEKAQGASAAAAVAVVQAKGYTPNDASQYHSNQTLRVLVGRKSDSGDGYAQQAFFFVNGRYIGTDTREPSATLRVIAQGDTEVTLGYPLYRRNDPLCCPGGGQATVRFQLNNGRLMPLDAIPPVERSGGLSRH
jgi:LppP/LprE lipoprotein